MADFADVDDNLIEGLALEGLPDAGAALLTDADGDDGDTVITIAGEEDAAPASEKDGTQLVRHLRDRLREKEREMSRLRAQVAPPPAVVDPGPEPDLESCGWDDAAYKAALRKWDADVATANAAKDDAKRGQDAAQAAWATKVTQYESQKAALRMPDYQDAEDTVAAALSLTAQQVIIKAAGNVAHVVAALAKHPAKLEAFSKIADPIDLAVAVANLERTIQVSASRKGPAPERIPAGGATTAGRTDKHLERLEAEAERSGDRTKVVAYRRSLKAKA